jgi:hypothetical protein
MILLRAIRANLRDVAICAGILSVTCLLQAATVNGRLLSGGTSLRNVNVALLEATAGAPTVIAQAKSDSTGHFQISSPTNSTTSIFFITAEIDTGVQFIAVLGTNLPANVTINELTTVAASYSMAQFLPTGTISGDGFALRIAAGMNENLVDVATGSSSEVLLSSPNADETNSLRMTRSLANVLVACVNSRSATAELLSLTRPTRGRRPENTAEALAALARDPGQNVEQISRLSRLYRYYLPELERAPDAWAVTVKVNDSGSDAVEGLIGGPGNLVFDAKGYAWITNNVVQGTTGSNTNMIVLKPNGKPSDGSGGTPTSPMVGGGLLGGGYGITIDPQGNVWEGNFGWGDENPSLDGNGSISEFSPSGAPISGPLGYQGGPLRAQGMVADKSGNIWIASFENDSVFVFPGGDPNNAIQHQQYAGSGPFGVGLAPDGTVWVSNGLVGVQPNSLARYELRNGALHEKVLLRPFGKELRGLSVDSRGNAWVTSQGESVVYAVALDGTVLGGFSGGGINGPWGTAVDGDDSIWVANFGPLQARTIFSAGLSKLCGINTAACPPGVHTGEPLSPTTGYTVPSAGSQVLLHTGDPLYGKDELPSFHPMMRQTACKVDAAGNVWTLNNWKPDFDLDATKNPGGDGIIIFVGIAKPPRSNN